MVLRDTTNELYLDGALYDSVASTYAPVVGSNTEVAIGYDYIKTDSRIHDCTIDEVFICPDDISAAEIQQLHAWSPHADL